MKKILIMLTSAFFILSCSQDDGLLPVKDNTGNSSELSVTEAQLKFAKLLSQAASNSLEVRSFLKKEALAQFDNDYDIFYPFVKNKIVSGNQSFREVLLSYSKEKNELTEIEQSLPLLNILIPDLSLFWNFNAASWNEHDEELAILCRNDKDNTLYENGENIGNLPIGEIPGFPCLVVKNSERMKVAGINTRSGEATYEFVSDAFDGANKVQTRLSDTETDLEATVDLDSYVNKDVVATAVKAWQEFKDVPNAYQRDYIYYGIDKTNMPGTLNKNIREELYRFRINANAFGNIVDADDDPKLEGYTQEKRYLSNEEILQKIWTDGKLEFCIKSYISSDNGKSIMEHTLIFSVKAEEVFSIEKVNVHHKNSKMFRHSKNTYTVDIDNLRSKWIYPRKINPNTNNQVFILPWDLYDRSLSFVLFVEELDSGQTIERTKTILNDFANKADFSIKEKEDANGEKLVSKLGYGFSYVNSHTNSFKVTSTVNTDELGSLFFLFYDPIIRAESNNAYKLYNVSSGNVTATILPMDLSTAEK